MRIIYKLIPEAAGGTSTPDLLSSYMVQLDDTKRNTTQKGRLTSHAR